MAAIFHFGIFSCSNALVLPICVDSQEKKNPNRRGHLAGAPLRCGKERGAGSRAGWRAWGAGRDAYLPHRGSPVCACAARSFSLSFFESVVA